MNILDFYGTPYSIKIVGRSTFKTAFSCLSSMLTVLAVCLFFFFISKDFFGRTNPKVIHSTLVPDQTEPVLINNANFTVAFKIETDSLTLLEERMFAFPTIEYIITERDEQGQVSVSFRKLYNPVPCTETDAINNPLISKFGVDSLFCIDYHKIQEDIKVETDLPLFGQWEEKYFSLFFISFTNCKFDEQAQKYTDCLSFEETLARSSIEDQYIVFYLPTTTFKPQNYEDPLETTYEPIYYKLSVFTDLFQTLKYSLLKLQDDSGTVFEYIEESAGSVPEYNSKEFRFLNKEGFESGKANMFTIELTFQRKQVHIKRVYIKIQELAASLGGFIKLVLLFFGALNKAYNTFRMQNILLASCKQGKKGIIQTSSLNNSTMSLKTRESLELSLKEYLLLQMGCFKNQKKILAVSRINRKLDITNILALAEKTYKPEAPLLERVHLETIHIRQISS